MKRNNFTTWPGLTESLIKKYLSNPVATAKGHLNQEHQGLQSTKPVTDEFPPQDNRTHDVVYSLVSNKDKAYMDLTGRFPFCSSRGNEYILIGYHYDANAILGVPLKNRQAVTITKMMLNGLLPNQHLPRSLLLLVQCQGNHYTHKLVYHNCILTNYIRLAFIFFI